jgi:predicted nucleic acid-binding protein
MRVVDASVWVSVFVPQDVNHRASRRWLERYVDGGGIVVEPALLLAEVTGAIARRTDRPALAQRTLLRIMAFPTLRLLSVDRQLGQAAA